MPKKKPPPSTPVKQEPPCPPEWEPSTGRAVYPQHSTLPLRQVLQAIADGLYLIPPFQRPKVWTEEQDLRFVGSLLEGYHTGTLLVWERSFHEASEEAQLGDLRFPLHPKLSHRMLVVDGQQRLSALASLYLSERYVYDFSQQQVVLGQSGQDRIPLHELAYVEKNALGRWLRIGAWCDLTEHGIHKWAWLQERVERIYLSFAILPSHTTPERVVESYRRLALEGTPMSAEHLAEGLERFQHERDIAEMLKRPAQLPHTVEGAASL